MTLTALRPGSDDGHPETVRHLLGLRPVGDIAAEVDAAPPAQWLFSTVWPSDAYGVVGAAQKVGKSWLMMDAAVSVASGTPWLDTFRTETAGPVVLFVGEGGARKMTRRGRAIAHHKGLVWDDLPILMAERVPRLSDERQINALAVELSRFPAKLVIIDPLYLAAAGANASQLYEMAKVLEPLQVTCQHAGTALMVAHHTNRDTSRKGSERFSGAGPAEWGRVLVTVDKLNEERDPATGRTDVRLVLDFDGDEIGGGKRTIHRAVWAEDPGELGSPMNYFVRREDAVLPAARGDAERERECAEALRSLFADHEGSPLTKADTRRELKDQGHTFRTETVNKVLDRLVSEGSLTHSLGPRNAHLFSLSAHVEEQPSVF